ncbi:NADPH-dependent FMN reductase [Aridibaculum aurantiacum]|uniref:NADPH-dependent FMN reductase n=1 Tax=Aridibaculum aurantiacum TaxID=2810307 RepID=UPI001A96CA88|nr:NAD(P)H-dependent oxidoreductase [Aridibaculum aurantiacum]
MNIAIVSGSPRQESMTYRLALYLQNHLRQTTAHNVNIIDVRQYSLMPMQEEVYTSVSATPDLYRPLAERMFAADAFIIVSPEYNGSYTAAMKNLFDHFPKQNHKPFGIVTASPGGLGGIRAAMQLQLFICALFGIPSPYMLVTPQVDKKFSTDGVLLDASFQKAIDTFIKEFLWLAERLAPGVENA